MRKPVHIIAACQMHDYGIGWQNTIPWKSSADLEFLKTTTKATDNPKLMNAVVMGRKTFSSIGKCLPHRVNYVITRNTDLHDGQLYFPSLEAALNAAFDNPLVEKVFILGGAEIYQQAMLNFGDLLDKAYITQIMCNYVCDRFLNYELFQNIFKLDTGRLIEPQVHGEPHCYIEEYTKRRCNIEEEQYLDLIRRILKDGEERNDRTGIGTVSLFGEKMVFDLSERIPILTTKKVPWKIVLRELLWFISGSTDNTILQKQKVHIWDGNTSRQFLDSRGLTNLPEGDIGAGYGHQWRHFGAEYIDCKTDYTGQGIDQLTEVIRLIKQDPTSRRILFTGWNPTALSRTALPPCHSIVVQFYVRGGKHLDCQMYQRSADVALGVPFNITSYAMLVYMIAHITGLQPGRFIHIIGDAHIYRNHVEPLRDQLNRVPYYFPKFIIKRKVCNIDDFVEGDFDVVDYVSHPVIKMEMAV